MDNTPKTDKMVEESLFYYSRSIGETSHFWKVVKLVSELEQELNLLKKDKARLDWLFEYPLQYYPTWRLWRIESREDIDAAMADDLGKSKLLY